MQPYKSNNESYWASVSTDLNGIWLVPIPEVAPDYKLWAIGKFPYLGTNDNVDMYVPLTEVDPSEECPNDVVEDWLLYDGIGYLQLPDGYVFLDCVRGKMINLLYKN